MIGELTSRPAYGGSDGPDAVIAPLSMLSGGPVEMSSVPFVCSAGRAAGGCWRAGALRVIVFHTDSEIHGGPDPLSTGLYSPYTGITPAPATWTSARPLLMSSGTLLLWLDAEAFAPAPAQFDEMLTDLGQPLTDRYGASATALGASCDAIVRRVSALVGP